MVIDGVAYVGTGTSGANFNDFWRFDHGLEIIEDAGFVQIEVFPNPTTENVVFKFSTELVNQIKNISIYALNGNLISYKEIVDNEYNWQSLTKGVFLYSIKRDDIILKTGKIVIK
jgi:hypothetical protein